MNIELTFTQQDALVILGAFPIIATILTSLIKTRFASLPDWVKVGIAILISLIFGAAAVYAQADLRQPVTVVALAALIFSEASIFYHTLWKGFGFEEKLQATRPPSKEEQENAAIDAVLSGTTNDPNKHTPPPGTGIE